jgi:hypothetical protein
MTQTNTNEHLQEIIINCLDRAMAGRAIPLTGPFQQALESQARIGWMSMLRGYWLQEWQDLNMSNPTKFYSKRPAKKRTNDPYKWEDGKRRSSNQYGVCPSSSGNSAMTKDMAGIRKAVSIHDERFFTKNSKQSTYENANTCNKYNAYSEHPT